MLLLRFHIVRVDLSRWLCRRLWCFDPSQFNVCKKFIYGTKQKGNLKITIFHVERFKNKGKTSQSRSKIYHWKYFKSGVWGWISPQTRLAFPCASPGRWFNCCSVCFFSLTNIPSANREQNNWPLKGGSSESEGTNTLFQTNTFTIPQAIQKKKTAAFPFNGNQVRAGLAEPAEPAQPRLKTATTVGSLCSFDFYFLHSLNRQSNQLWSLINIVLMCVP